MLANNELGTLHPIAELAANRARARRPLPHRRRASAGPDPARRPGAGGRPARALGAQVLRPERRRRALRPRGDGVAAAGGAAAARRPACGRAPRTSPAIVGLAGALELASRDAAARGRAPRGAPRPVRGRRPAERSGHPPQRGAGAAATAYLERRVRGPRGARGCWSRLDLEGLAVSAGSACAAGATEPSHVLAALGLPDSFANGTIRFSFGRLTGAQEVDRAFPAAPRNRGGTA